MHKIGSDNLRINQARFSAQGFASTVWDRYVFSCLALVRSCCINYRTFVWSCPPFEAHLLAVNTSVVELNTIVKVTTL